MITPALLQWLSSTGFAGTMAVIAALIAFASNQRATRASHRADRVIWALNQLVSPDPTARSAGFAALGVLAKKVRKGSEEYATITATLAAIAEATPVHELESSAEDTDQAHWENDDLNEGGASS